MVEEAHAPEVQSSALSQDSCSLMRSYLLVVALRQHLTGDHSDYLQGLLIDTTLV